MSKFHSSFVSFGRVQVSDIFKSKLFKYAIDGRVKKIDNLLSSVKDKNYDIDAQNTRGQTALFAACMLGHYKAVSLLLQLGANPNRRSDDGSTPTHAAAFSCNANVLQIICEYGGDLRLHDDRDLLPRDWALEAGPKRNKKILEQIDCWQNEVLSHIEGNHQEKRSISTTKLWKFNTSESVGNTSSAAADHNTTTTTKTSAPQRSINNSAFGNFSCFNDGQPQQFGFSALIPIIGADQLSEAHNEENITYQTPPHFQLSNGYWGNQAITRKKIRESKRRILRHMASTRDLMMREVNFLGHVRHANILTLLSTCVGKCTSDKNGESPTSELLSPHTLVFERISFGSLYGLLHDGHLPTTITSILRYLQQISNALEFIHQRGYIHCCVTSHSVHIVNSSTAKLSDFYYSTQIDDMNGIATPISSAFNRWVAPELLADKKPTVKCDVYSYGVVLCEVVSGTLPWQSYDVESIRHQVVTKGKKFPLPEAVPVDFLPVLRESLEISRRKRNIKLQEISFFIKKIIANYSRCLESAKLNGGGRMSSTMLPPPDEGVDVVDAVPCYNPPPPNNTGLRNFNEKSSSLNQRHHHRFGSYKTTTTTSSKVRKRYSLPPDHSLETAPTIQSFSYGKDAANLQEGGEFPTTMQHDISPVVNDRKPDDGDHVGDESAGLVHPILMDSDSFDSSLAESYGYQRRNTDDDEEIQQHNNNNNNDFRIIPPAARHEYDDDVIIHHVTATSAQQRHHAVRSRKSPHTGLNVEPPTVGRVETPSLQAIGSIPPPPVPSSDRHNNRTYKIDEEDVVRRYAQQETQTEETNEAPTSEGGWKSSSLNRCGGFRNNRKKPTYVKRRREPSKMASFNMRRKTVKKVDRSASDPLRKHQINEERGQILHAVPEHISVLPEHISGERESEEVNDVMTNDESGVEIQETVDRVHNSLVELSRMLTSPHPPTRHHDVIQSRDHHDDVIQSRDHHDDVIQSRDHRDDVIQSHDHHDDVIQSRDHHDDVIQSRDDDVITHMSTAATCNSSQLQIIREPIPTTTHVIDNDHFDDVTILTCGGDDDVTSGEEEERPQVVRKEQQPLGVESLSSFAIEVIDACSNYFPNAMQHYRKQPPPPVVTSSSEEECGSDDGDTMTSDDDDSRKQRRFSLGSSDLEDLYSKFADRKSFRPDDDVTNACDDVTHERVDDVTHERVDDVTHERVDDDSSDDDSNSPPCDGSDDDGSYSGGKSPSQMFAMDDDCDVTPPPRVDEVDDVTGRDVTITLRRVNSCIEAQAPPQLEDFIESTSVTNSTTFTTNHMVAHVWRSKSDCALPKKKIQQQVGHSRSMTSQPQEKLFPYLSMTKPGSHGVCLTRNKQAATSSAGDVIIPPPHTPKSVANGVVDYQLDVTPSKWSFAMKREVFEPNHDDVIDEKKCDVTTAAPVMTTPVNPPSSLLRHEEKGVKTSTPLDRHHHNLLTPPSGRKHSSGGRGGQLYLGDESGTYEQISDIQKYSGYEGVATSGGDEVATRGSSEEDFSGISYDDSTEVKGHEVVEIQEDESVFDDKRSVDEDQRSLDDDEDQRSLDDDEDQRSLEDDEDQRNVADDVDQRSIEDDEDQRSIDDDEDQRNVAEDRKSVEEFDEMKLEEEDEMSVGEDRGNSTSIWVESNEEDEQLQQQQQMIVGDGSLIK